MVTSRRVLLVEDDLNVQRFVRMALDPLDIDFVPCGTLAQARQALEAAPAAVVLTDLTLPDGSGLDLLAWMQARPDGAQGACRTVVFSGGIDAATQRQLDTLQVWRVLHKPGSVGALMACVADALDSVAAAPAEAHAEAGAEPAHSPDPVVEFFAGNTALYNAYRQTCLARLPEDLAAGDRAAALADCAALRHVAHNLKSVLTLLGEAEAAQRARATEEQAAAGASAAAVLAWRRLRDCAFPTA